ncbi:MAG: hypothetical protein IH845_03145 [Nanoarchaeota archaeon]|nr:hypothetical protein [Nanoarchaeota archaeon]
MARHNGIDIFHGHLKRRVLTIGIAIVFVMFIGYAISTFYSELEYKDYCGEFKTLQIIETEEQCLAVGGQWNGNFATPRGEVIGEPKISGYCDRDFTCRGEYDDERSVYNRNVFFVSLVIGLATVVGAIFLTVESVSAGLMGGGILLILYGTTRYWGDLSDIWRTLMLGFALFVLVYVGYKKLK